MTHADPSHIRRDGQHLTWTSPGELLRGAVTVFAILLGLTLVLAAAAMAGVVLGILVWM